MSTSKLMKVTYYDPKSQIRLLCYADTVVWDTKPTPTLTALRFGGYPERVQGLADAIYGGATIEIEDGKDTYSLKTLTRQYRRELSHDGVYAEAMTTLMAKELMLGIKDSVEDVSAMFKRMANLKPQAAAWSIFAEAPTAQDETVLVKKAVNEPIVEFTFGNPVPLQTPKPVIAATPVSTPMPKAAVKPHAKRKSAKAVISEDQIPLFKIA